MRSLQTLARNCARTLPLPPPVIFLFLRILRVQSVGLRVSSLGWELRISSGDPPVDAAGAGLAGSRVCGLDRRS
jgi:hypothetical protein